MKPRAYQALKAEFASAKRQTKNTYHQLWRAILQEYGMNNFFQLLDYIHSFSQVNETSLFAANGRVASLNVLIRKMRSLATIRNPEFQIHNETPRDEPIAEVLEQAFNALQKRIGWTPTMRSVLLSALLHGSGYAKVGLSSQYLYGETAWSDDIPPKSAGLSDWERDAPYGPTTEFQNHAVLEEWPNVVWVPTTNIFFNPGARTKGEIARTYHRYRRRLIDVKRDARYDRRVRARITGVNACSTEDDAFLTDLLEDYADDTSYVELIECFDHSSRQFCVFADEADAPLRDWTPFPLPIDTPFIEMTPIEFPESIYGIPYAMLLLNHSQAKNHMRAVLIDQIGRDGKTVNFIDPAGFKEEDYIDRINAAKHNEFLPYDNLAGFERPPIHTVNFTGASPELLRLMSIIERDEAWVSGLTDQARNDFSGGEQTATEVSYRQQQQGLTVDEFVHLNEEFQEEVAAAICKIMLATWPESRLVKITGPTPQTFFWVPIERRRVLNTFSIQIVAGSTERLDKLTQRRQWNEVLPRFVQLVQYAQQDQIQQMQGYPPSLVNWPEMLKITLDMFDTSLSHKVLRFRDPASLAIRLVEDHGIYPANMSPELAQQIKMLVAVRNQELNQPPNVVPFQGLGGGGMSPSFEETNRVAQPAGLQFGMAPQDVAGFQTGRAQSETRST
ncbi:MAG: hypothetical protein RBU21_05920 [FCB group bacterium]|jgi:hypothetical protein|nr:hypothetical protein [FCB group bacterium]